MYYYNGRLIFLIEQIVRTIARASIAGGALQAITDAHCKIRLNFKKKYSNWKMTYELELIDWYPKKKKRGM